MHVRSPNTVPSHSQNAAPQNNLQRFRARFTRVLRDCVRHRFSVEECFGAVFDETLHEIPLTEEQQSVLYRELLTWVKQSADLFPIIHHPYSPLENHEIGTFLSKS